MSVANYGRSIVLGRGIASTAAVAIVMLVCSCHGPSKKEPRSEFTTSFDGESLVPKHLNRHIDPLKPELQRYFIRVPAAYSGDGPYGLIVFTDADDEVTDVPDGWASVLDTRKFLFIAAEKAGNDQDVSKRLGLAVLGALEMIKHYRIDLDRVYAAGFSGGARMSGMLGFFQPDIFRGTIQNSGADFYRPVAQVYATSLVDTIGKPYGLFDATADEIAQAQHVRFALITGTNDFRRGNILDVYNGGFAKEGFQAKLFDVPGMGHEICSADTLSAALDFLDGRR